MVSSGGHHPSNVWHGNGYEPFSLVCPVSKTAAATAAARQSHPRHRRIIEFPEASKGVPEVRVGNTSFEVGGVTWLAYAEALTEQDRLHPLGHFCRSDCIKGIRTLSPPR